MALDSIEIAALNSVLIGFSASVFTGIVKSLSDRVKKWPPLAKQGLVLAFSVGLIVFLNVIDMSMIPENYQDTLGVVMTSLVAALTGVGLHNVKDGVVDSGDAGTN